MIINKAYRKALSDKSEIMLFWGGKGSGKSHAAAQKIVSRMINEHPHRFLVVHRYERKIKETCYLEIEKVIRGEIIKEELDSGKIIERPLSDDFNFWKSPLSIEYKPNGNMIIFNGLDSGEKLQSYADITSCWIEEATMISEDDFKLLDLSIRGITKHYKQMILTFNPIDINSWINKRFFIEKSIPASSYFTTLEDNAFNGEDYEKKFERYKGDKVLYDWARHGIWGKANDATIFTNWEVTKVNTDVSYYDDVMLGVDWGFQHSMACVMVGLKDDNIFIIKELTLKQKPDTYFIEKIQNEFNNNIITTTGHDRPGSTSLLNDGGFYAKSANVNRYSVMGGINYLRRNQIHIDESCKETIENFKSYQFKQDKNGNVLDTEPLAINDDCISAIRYALDDYISLKQSRFEPVYAYI